jgi:hypothetical protein
MSNNRNNKSEFDDHSGLDYSILSETVALDKSKAKWYDEE